MKSYSIHEWILGKTISIAEAMHFRCFSWAFTAQNFVWGERSPETDPSTLCPQTKTCFNWWMTRMGAAESCWELLTAAEAIPPVQQPGDASFSCRTLCNHRQEWGRTGVFCFVPQKRSFSTYFNVILVIKGSLGNLTSDYTESCRPRYVNKEIWSRRCDTAEMFEMRRFWRVGIARNAVLFFP